MDSLVETTGRQTAEVMINFSENSLERETSIVVLKKKKVFFSGHRVIDNEVILVSRDFGQPLADLSFYWDTIRN